MSEYEVRFEGHRPNPSLRDMQRHTYLDVDDDPALDHVVADLRDSVVAEELAPEVIGMAQIIINESADRPLEALNSARNSGEEEHESPTSDRNGSIFSNPLPGSSRSNTQPPKWGKRRDPPTPVEIRAPRVSRSNDNERFVESVDLDTSVKTLEEMWRTEDHGKPKVVFEEERVPNRFRIALTPSRFVLTNGYTSDNGSTYRRIDMLRGGVYFHSHETFARERAPLITLRKKIGATTIALASLVSVIGIGTALKSDHEPVSQAATTTVLPSWEATKPARPIIKPMETIATTTTENPNAVYKPTRNALYREFYHVDHDLTDAEMDEYDTAFRNMVNADQK